MLLNVLVVCQLLHADFVMFKAERFLIDMERPAEHLYSLCEITLVLRYTSEDFSDESASVTSAVLRDAMLELVPIHFRGSISGAA